MSVALDRVSSLPWPQILSLEMSTKCTADCYICPRRMIERKDREMPIEDIFRITREACEMGVRRISPHLWGEPTMHSRYVEILHYFKGLKREYPDVAFLEYTNGSGWGDIEVCRAQQDVFDKIVVSIDGADHKTMRENRPGLDPAVIDENVKGFMDLRERRGLEKPLVYLRMTVMPRTEGQEEAYRKKWLPYVDEVAFLPLQNFDESLVEEVDLREGRPCDRLFYQIVVTVNKNVVLCCSDYNELFILGNLGDHTLRDLWFGGKMGAVRRLHLEGRSAEVPLCRACTYRTYLSEGEDGGRSK